MELKNSRWQTFLQEVKRRKVFQVVVAYIAFAWLAIQVADVLADTFDIPSWFLKALFITLVIGLPVTGVLAWIFDIKHGSIIKTKELPHPSLLDIKPIPIIFHGSIGNSLGQQERQARFKDFILWAQDYNANNHKSFDNDYMVLFDNSIDALRYAIRIQNHSQQLKIPFSISVIEARAELEQQDEANEIARARALAIDSLSGAIVTTETIRKAIKNRQLPLVEKALKPLDSADSKIEQQEYIIDPEQISEVNRALKNYSETILYPTTPTSLKLASLLFLTVIAAGLWRFIPTIETNEEATLTILPLKSLTTTTEDEVFTSGFSDDIFYGISSIPDINLISRRSSQSFKNSDLSVQEIGKLLNADLILEGSIHRMGQMVRVSLWISDSKTGLEKWNKSYDLESNNLLAARSEIVSSISKFLNKSDSPNSVYSNTKALTKDLYPSYLQAKGILKQPKTMARLRQAESLLKEILSKQSDYEPAISALCDTYFSMYTLKFDSNLFEQAEAECSKTYQMESKNIETLLALASLHSYKGNYGLVSQYMEEAKSINPSDVQVLYTFAWIEKQKGNPDDAINYVNQALLIEPNYWRLHKLLGNIHIEAGQWDRAISQYQNVLSLNPDESSSYVNLGNAYFFKAEFDKAALAYQQALEFNEDDVALSNIATMWFYHGDFSKAANYYLKAIQITPNQYLYWLNLADTKEQEVNYQDEAQSHYEHASKLALQLLQHNPNDANALITVAWCFAKTKRTTEATSHLIRALNLTPEDPNILYMAAKVAAQTGDNSLGKEYLNKAIQNGFPISVIEASPFAKNLKLYPL